MMGSCDRVGLTSMAFYGIETLSLIYILYNLNNNSGF